MKTCLKQIIHSVSRTRLMFFITGIIATVWFLIRVIPKPSRAGYPCMKASAPFMSAFILYLIGLFSTIYLFREKKGRLLLLKSVLGIVFIVSLLISFRASSPAIESTLVDATFLAANEPIGVAKGIHPGRVVWVMDKNATNEYCTNTDNDFWFMDENTDQTVVEKMLTDGIKNLSGEPTSAMAWDAIFKYFNSNHNKGAVGYKSGEKIVVKINCTTLGNGGRNLNDALNATPQLAMALLEQLIDTMKIAQSNITLGDPYRGMPDEIYIPCHTKYPNVHYIEGLGTNGREQTKISTTAVFFTSDNKFQSRLPQAYLDAAYLINMPSLKTHNSAGITLGAKNHQGSVIDASQNATNQSMISYLHYDYPVDGGVKNQQMGIYRHIVDYMAHKNLGGNTLLYLVDGLWSGRNWDGQIEKWQMSPFNDDWTSSLFLSQDPVAIESVGFDFLYNEYKLYPGAHGNVNFPLVAGVQDYIYQAADPASRPSTIKYDPSSSAHSSPVGSLGVEEHWNNNVAKQYSRNLGLNNGIELISVPSSLVATSITENSINQTNSLSVFPNPVVNVATFKYMLSGSANVHIECYSLDGKQVIHTQNLRQLAGINTFSLNVKDSKLSTGTYICKVIASGSSLNTFTSKISIQ